MLHLVFYVLACLCLLNYTASFELPAIHALKRFARSTVVPATIVANFAVAGMLVQPCSADMLTFPLVKPLKNNIVLMRAGQSKMDARDMVETNPVKKLATTNGLTPEGRSQVAEAAKTLLCSDNDDDTSFSPSWVWTSNTERAYESATIIARECQLGQNRVVPEFSFLDARGMGSYEGKPSQHSYEEVHALDEKGGVRNRPPPASDGTPSESVSDVLVRINQLVSTLEAVYSGENVVIVAPDSDVLSVLQAALADDDPDESLPRHARFAFANGESRPLATNVRPLDRLITGQTFEEADRNRRRYRALRVPGRKGSSSSSRAGVIITPSTPIRGVTITPSSSSSSSSSSGGSGGIQESGSRGGGYSEEFAREYWDGLYRRAVDSQVEEGVLITPRVGVLEGIITPR